MKKTDEGDIPCEETNHDSNNQKLVPTNLARQLTCHAILIFLGRG